MLILLISTFVYFIINVNLFIEYMNQLFDPYKYILINLLKHYLALLSKLMKNYFFINSTKVRIELINLNFVYLNYFAYFDNNENIIIKIIFFVFITIIAETTNYHHCF